MQLSFHGAAGDVTGSCHLLEVAGKRILIDCGMFQGSRQLHDENAGPFGFDAATIDWLLLTHAHLDHCGRIPLLVKRGFRGRIRTTAATLDLAKLVLMDSAALQREEMRDHPPQAGGGKPGAPASPLYDSADVQAAMALASGDIVYGQGLELAPGIRVTFQNAGHILGSASILVDAVEGGVARRIVFSGDLGNRDKPVLDPPTPSPAADDVVMESTYGDRNHRSQAESIAEFRSAVEATLRRGGNVVIPTFALERAQDLLYYLREMVEQNLIPAQTPVYLDSPMAISATEIFRRHREIFNSATGAMLAAGHDPFTVPGLHFTRDRQASMAINSVHGAIIMAGSGMAAGGRILHHLRHNLANPHNSIIFVGYAARGTVGRLIIDGAKQVHLFDDVIPVRAQITTISGFSAHADHDDLIAWVKSAGKSARIFLVHGEAAAAEVLARDLGATGLDVHIPALNDSVNLAAAAIAGT